MNGSIKCNLGVTFLSAQKTQHWQQNLVCCTPFNHGLLYNNLLYNCDIINHCLFLLLKRCPMCFKDLRSVREWSPLVCILVVNGPTVNFIRVEFKYDFFFIFMVVSYFPIISPFVLVWDVFVYSGYMYTCRDCSVYGAEFVYLLLDCMYCIYIFAHLFLFIWKIKKQN